MEELPELDNTSYHHALTNIANNNLSPRIHLIKVDETPDSRSTVPEQSTSTTSTTFNFDQLFGFKNHLSDPQAQSDKTDRIGGLDIQFTMCNPPFYGSTHEMTLGAAEKEDRPFGVSHHPSFLTCLADQLHFYRFAPVRRLR